MNAGWGLVRIKHGFKGVHLFNRTKSPVGNVLAWIYSRVFVLIIFRVQISTASLGAFDGVCGVRVVAVNYSVFYFFFDQTNYIPTFVFATYCSDKYSIPWWIGRIERCQNCSPWLMNIMGRFARQRKPKCIIMTMIYHSLWWSNVCVSWTSKNTR